MKQPAASGGGGSARPGHPELRLIRAFIAVAETLHFGRAAERLHIAQPPLSRQIRQLEAELGVTLLMRSSHGVAVTESGRAFLEAARGVVRQVEDAVRVARRAQLGELGQLEVGFVDSAMFELLPRTLSRFRQRFPRIELKLHEMNSALQLADLREKRLHVGIIRPPTAAEAIALEIIDREPLVAAVPARHPLARTSGAAIRALAGEIFIALPREHSPWLHDRLTSALLQNGVTLRVGQEAQGVGAMVSMVAAGLGVALVPASARILPYRDVAYVPLEASAPVLELALAWRRDDSSPLVQNFASAVRDALTSARRPSAEPGPRSSAVT